MKKLILAMTILAQTCMYAAGTGKIRAVCLFPDASDRETWEKVQKRPSVQIFRKEIVSRAEKLPGKDIPELSAAKYMDFQRKGERKPFEKNYYLRRVNMETLVLAELFEHKGRFTDEIINHLWAILSEPTWCVSAHAGLSPQDPLPDFEWETVDLFSAETSARLSMVLQLMEKELNAVSPSLVRRMKRTITERAIVPIEKKLADFWWKEGGNNWTPWICSNLLVAANTVLAENPERLAAYVNLLQPCMDRYYARFSDDGACEEGSSYWGKSVGGAMLYYLQLHAMTDGGISIFKEQKFRKMCEFISDNWFGEKHFVTFSDCPALIRYQPIGLLSKTADMLKSASLKDFGRAYRKECPIVLATHDTLTAVLASLFWEDDLPAAPRGDFSVYYDKMQLLLIRSGQVHFAAIGHHNAGGHHHLDVGGFILAFNGQEQILDLGGVTYTKEIFSSSRFNNPVLNSLYHNVPVFDGKGQGNGAEFAARDVSYEQKGTKHLFTMDLASAYPKEYGIRKCIRTFVFDAEDGALEVTDRWEADQVVSYGMTLFTMTNPETCVIRFQSNAPVCLTESFTVTDAAQITNWGKQLWKTNLSFPKAKSGTHQITFRPQSKSH